MVTMQHMTHDGYVELHASGKLDRNDYLTLTPEIEQLIREEGKLRVVFVLEDFHGWTAGGLWEDVKFDLRHFNDVERLAIVGDRKWQERMASVCRMFTTAEIKFFERDRLEDARLWVRHAALTHTPEVTV